MHEIAQNCVCNAQQSLAAARSGVKSAPPSPLVAWGVGKPMPRHLSLNAFGVSLRRLRRLKSNVPLPKQFSGSASVWSCVSSEMSWVEVSRLFLNHGTRVEVS